MRLLVRSITLEAEDIVSFELVDPERLPLPPFDAGSHVEIAMTNGESRPYSLCNDPAERDRYRIAVLREVAGRGGSRFMHENVRVGQMLDLSLPRNNFALAAGARRHRLIAGGIGITPLLSMAHALDRRGDPYELHYCARSPSRAAFRDELARLSGGAVSLHYDNGDPSHGLDVSGLLRDVVDGMHVYYCGPRGLMRAASEATAHWPRETIHFEHFAAPVAVPPIPSIDGAFEVELASNAAVYPVPANRSILAVLRDAGVLVESSCEAGVCGTCRTRYLAGTPDHQDFVLTDDERRECIMLCVSRAAPGERIVLDL